MRDWVRMVLGGFLPRLAATVCVLKSILLCDSDCARTWEVGVMVEGKEETVRNPAWAKLNPVERALLVQ